MFVPTKGCFKIVIHVKLTRQIIMKGANQLLFWIKCITPKNFIVSYKNVHVKNW